MDRTLNGAGETPMRNKAYWAAFLLGIATMAATDEVVFHQILAWHHFYDGSASRIGLVSDGLLHAAELFLFVFGFFLMLDARRRGVFSPASAWAGFLVGLGLFQLWDGVMDHKVLRVHQIRYGVELLPYDIVWNLVGGGLLLAGILWTIVLGRKVNSQGGEARPGGEEVAGVPRNGR